jgi:regulator of replication initiation timing
MSDNSSIDKLAEQYTETESDAKAYQKAQAATIIAQTKQINELRKKLEELVQQTEQLTIENTRLKALNPNEEFDTEDAETIAVVQLALLRNYAMQRELTLEECKKSEIYVKILKELRSAQPKEKQESIGNLSNEELLAAMKALGEG